MEDAGGADEVDLSCFVVCGTASALEKSYFRLTSAPDPATVRPEAVLSRALQRLNGLLRSGAVNYFYAQDQFKGLRQDCTVQHLRSPLAAAVYESHARAALEYGDTAEYNQCQAQLDGLYADGVSGCKAEFTAYRILYQTAHARAGNSVALLNTLRAVPPEVSSYLCSCSICSCCWRPEGFVGTNLPWKLSQHVGLATTSPSTDDGLCW